MKNWILGVLFWCVSVSSFAAVGIKNFDPAQTFALSKQEVYWIYTLKTRFWSDGTKITVFYLDFTHPVHVAFVRNVLGSSPISFQNSVETYMNVGNASYFRKASSELDVYLMVSRTPGSVGYVSDQLLLINYGDNRVRSIRIVD